MIKRLGMLMVVLSLLASSTFAAELVDDSRNLTPRRLLEVTIKSLEMFKANYLNLFQLIDAYDALDETDNTHQDVLTPEKLPSLVQSLDRLSAVLKQLITVVGPFEGSDDEAIRQSSQQMKEALTQLNNKIESIQERITREDAASHLEDIEFDIASAISAFDLGYYQAASSQLKEPLKDDEIMEKGRFGFTQEERWALILDVEGLFGEKVPLLEGYHLQNTASLILDFLRAKNKNDKSKPEGPELSQ